MIACTIFCKLLSYSYFNLKQTNLIRLNFASTTPPVKADGEVRDRGQLPHDKVPRGQLGEGVLPIAVNRHYGDLSDVGAEHKLVLDILEDHVVAHNLN